MSRISRIAKKIIGAYDIDDIIAVLEMRNGAAYRASEAMTEALEALRKGDLNNAFRPLARLSPTAKAVVPSHVMEWLEQMSGKELPREGWKIQVARSIEQVFGRGRAVDWEYSSFLTYSEGTSNKFHYFAVIKAGNEYVGGNAYGRIGTTAKVIEIARSSSKGSVMSAVMAKEDEKERKGYQKS